MHSYSASSKLTSALTKLIKCLQELSLSVEDCLTACLQGYFKAKMMSYPEISLFLSELQHAVSSVCVRARTHLYVCVCVRAFVHVRMCVHMCMYFHSCGVMF